MYVNLFSKLVLFGIKSNLISFVTFKFFFSKLIIYEKWIFHKNMKKCFIRIEDKKDSFNPQFSLKYYFRSILCFSQANLFSWNIFFIFCDVISCLKPLAHPRIMWPYRAFLVYLIAYAFFFAQYFLLTWLHLWTNPFGCDLTKSV